MSDWFTYSPTTGGTGSTQMAVSAIATSQVSERSGRVVVTDVSGRTANLTVRQRGWDYITISPSALTFLVSGGSQNIQITSNGNWTLSYPNWVTVSPTAGSGDTLVNVMTESNSGNPDITGLLIGDMEHASASTIVFQYGDFVATGSVTTSAITADPSGGTYNNGVTTNVPWTATTSDNWLSVNPTSGTSGYTDIVITISENATGVIRVGYIYIRAIADGTLLATITVTQDPKETGANDYLTFVFSGDTGSTTLRALFEYPSATTFPTQYLEFSVNGGDWQRKSTITLDYSGYWRSKRIDLSGIQAGDVVKVRGELTFPMTFQLVPYDWGPDGNRYIAGFPCSVSGNVMSLAYGANFTGKKTIPEVDWEGNGLFCGLFAKLGDLVSIDGIALPATGLTKMCYRLMFDGTSITEVPSGLLPATTLKEGCYAGMFRYTFISSLPSNFLPATTLKEACYSGMFANCTLLSYLPSDFLPATNLDVDAYYSMFEGCVRLGDISSLILPATIVPGGAYENMFYRCSGLTSAPSILPATQIHYYSYANMFKNCVSLITAPSISATTLNYGWNMFQMFEGCTSLVSGPPTLPALNLGTYDCYARMFAGCTSLVNPPTLPATTLAHSCYVSMFNGCTSLVNAPELPATTLNEMSYEGMFYGCSRLNYVKCMATDKSANNCTKNWLYGVASSGTLEKASGVYWTYGSPSALPQGWTQVDA